MLLHTSGEKRPGSPRFRGLYDSLQRTWTGYAINMATCFGMGEEDVYLAFLPFFHVAGFGTALSQLILGGTIVTAPLADPGMFYRLIAEHRVSIVFLTHQRRRRGETLSWLRLGTRGRSWSREVLRHLGGAVRRKPVAKVTRLGRSHACCGMTIPRPYGRVMLPSTTNILRR
ncbi:MAG: AMP-binding protein [Proteobacteria bacterium]|nr:AMP-binding protein [Pseudomonadota bacterium]